MANICDTQYKVMGERKAVADLWYTLLTMEVNTKNVSLNRLAEHYGIDYEKMGISVRGHIYWAELRKTMTSAYCPLTLKVLGLLVTSSLKS